MAQTQLLDLVTGGSALPYIYCKKITLENSQTEGFIKTILNLEIYRDTNAFTKSSIFNMFDSNIQNYLYMQIAPFKEASNILKLQPNHSISLQNKAGNVYIARSHPKYQEHYNTPNIERFTHLPVGQIFDDARTATYGGFVFNDNEGIDNLPAPVMIGDSLSMPASRQEVINGKPYDVITYEYIHEYEIPQSSMPHLGFLFYCFLDVPRFISGLGDNIPPTNTKILTGPVNTEIVLRNGTPAEKMYQFYTPGGQKWNGSVHLHTEDNPALSDLDNPYFGDGSVGPNKGWMTGEKHISGIDQPKLNLALSPNYRLQDFRSKKIIPQENVLGLAYVDGKRTLNNSKFTEAQLLTTDVAKYFLMPFQKEAKKYISKIDYIAGKADGKLVAGNAYDNDSEYSKLYINKDASGTSRGVFMVDFLKLLSNNSNIFSLLSPTILISENILNGSQLLELNIYRDRVEKKPLGNVYETYVNDTSYEEPSYLIASLSKNEIVTKKLFAGITLTKNSTACFSFSDNSFSEQQAGAYQYRVELSYKDGAYTYLRSRLNALKNAYSNLQQYYEFSQSSFATEGQGIIESNENFFSLTKTVAYTPYYKDGAYHERFNIDANNHFTENQPWQYSIIVIIELTEVFAIDEMWGDEEAAAISFINMVTGLDPIEGSPYGIELVLKITQTFINRIEKILGTNKKRGASLTAAETPTTVENNSLSTPSSALIKEYHTFDHPSEIIRATPNKNVYVDYISTGVSKQDSNIGLLSIGPTEFKNRCFLDLAELSGDFDAEDKILGSSDQAIDLSGATESITDAASNSAFSYLSPSILSLTKENSISKFKKDADYKSFDALEEITEEKYAQFLNALISYNLSKNDSDDYDSFTKHNVITQIDGGSIGMPTKLDETYKDIFDTIGITVYNSKNYDAFFDKDPGPISKKIDPENGALLPKSANDYNDGELGDQIKNHLDTLLYDDTDFFNSPTKKHPVEGMFYNSNLPNIHKLAIVFKKTAGANNDLDYDPRGLFAESIDSGEMTPYSFINYNFVSQVEVYDATIIDASKPLKDDSYLWRLLKESDINNLSAGDTLLCRIRFFNQNSTQGIEMPLVNNIFFLKPADNAGFVTISSAQTIAPMPFVLPFQSVSQQIIIRDLRNESVAAVKKASKKKGKNLLAGKAVIANKSGASQSGTTKSSPVKSSPVTTGPVAGQKKFGNNNNNSGGGPSGGYN